MGRGGEGGWGGEGREKGSEEGSVEGSEEDGRSVNLTWCSCSLIHFMHFTSLVS